MTILLFFAAHWYFSLFFQTLFHHRYAAHRMFTMSRFWEKMFFVFSYIAQGSSYLSPYAYGIMHRMHHAYADTELDPHSPKYDGNIWKMMWKTKIIYSDILSGKTKVDQKFLGALPQWTKFDYFTDMMATRVIFALGYVAFYFFFATSWWMWLLLPIHFIMSPVHGAVINWFAHRIGYTNFKVKDTSKNILPVDILMLGEGYHNNHHRFGSRPNFGVRWFELDPVYPFIKLFNALGIVRLKKQGEMVVAPVMQQEPVLMPVEIEKVA